MNKLKIISTLCALLLSFVLHASEPTRRSYNLNEDWHFFYASALDGGNADRVTLPHTWNSVHGEGEYLRTVANYTRELHIPAEWQGKRLFLRFGGVHSSADIFLNGCYVGSHEGSFTAFTMEITDRVRCGTSNFLRVVVSNVISNHILPISTDMDLSGGIYSDVELLVTPKNIISPLHHSTDGVYVVQQSVTEDLAKGVVRVFLSTSERDHIGLALRIVGDDGYEVYRRNVRNAKLSDEGYVDIPFEIANPELWSPDRPTLYGVEVVLGDEHNMEDRVTVTTGMRSVSVDADNRLCINGKPVAVRGVNLAHDRRGRGMVCSKEDMAADLAIIDDMGANAIRSLLGPHASYLYDRCDRDGRLVWVDMPFSRSPLSLSDICYYPTASFRENGFMQLSEIVAQNFNHPSVVMWGLFDQVWQRGDDVVAYVRELNERAHTMDPSRLTVGCSNSDGGINFVTDLIVFRQNVGYMKGSVEDVKVWCRQLRSNTLWSTMRYGVCYGEEGNMEHRAEKIERAQRGTRLLPERRQTYMHERYADIISEADVFWGVWLSAMFDYASSSRPYGLNQSGVVCHDHATKKDAFYLYRAKWNASKATLHIADRRWYRRGDGLQHINVYSSVGEPIMVINGDTALVRCVSDGQYRADSLELSGRVEVVVADPTGEYTDRVELSVGDKNL